MPAEWYWCTMNVNGFTDKRIRSRMGRCFLMVLTAGLLLGSRTSEAASTKTKKLDLTPSEVQTFEVWTKFLAKGTETWSTTHAPPFTPAVESTIWQVLKTDSQAQSLSNPMIQYLEWRRSLDPTRFTSYHPNLSPALAQLLSSPSLPAGVPPPTYTPVPQVSPQTVSEPSGTPATSSGAQTVSPPAVPEPNSLLLATTMTGIAIWWRRRLARRIAGQGSK